MDKCRKARESLADYRSGVLRPGKVAWVDEHFNQCSECANELRALDDILALVDANTPECEPPVGLWNGVFNRITSPQPARYNGFRRRMSKPIRAAGVGAAALALAIGLIMSTGPRDDNATARIASNLEYVRGHALYAGQAPLADRVRYLSVVAASYESSETQVR